MESFLNFLSNNYLYFLIAAGVLLFALIGFLVDMKKKNKIEETIEETPTLEPSPVTEAQTYNPTPIEPVPDVMPEVLASPDVTPNPAPPMPTTAEVMAEEPVSVASPVVEPIATAAPTITDEVEELK